MTNDLDEIRRLKDGVASAEEQLEAFIKERWPDGSEVQWLHGWHTQYGRVVNSFRDRLKVRNDKTGSEYWIDIYLVECALAKAGKKRAAA